MTFAVGDFVLLTLLACFTSYRLFFSRKYPHSLPPGPKGWPLIGNAFDMPKTHSWRTFAQWGKKWGRSKCSIYCYSVWPRIFTFLSGPIMSVKVLGTPFIIISNPDIADEMLGKTGSLYADRPTVQMALLTGWVNDLYHESAGMPSHFDIHFSRIERWAGHDTTPASERYHSSSPATRFSY